MKMVLTITHCRGDNEKSVLGMNNQFAVTETALVILQPKA